MTSKAGKTRFFAWTGSILVHVAVLAVFMVVRFSGAAETDVKPIPTTRIAMVEKLLAKPLITPKPNVLKPGQLRKTATVKTVDFGDVQLVSPAFETDQQDFKLPSNAHDNTVNQQNFTGARSEFFSTVSGCRKICYVVDASGSMKGVFPEIRQRLLRSIADLEPDQYFYVIFFGDARLYESGMGRLIRASAANKKRCCQFIETMRASGLTNAAGAIRRALQIYGPDRNKCEIIYFLTDGFELDENETDFSLTTQKMIGDIGTGTRINTIGFWPQEKDRLMLQEISRRSGGEFVLVDDLKAGGE